MLNNLQWNHWKSLGWCDTLNSRNFLVVTKFLEWGNQTEHGTKSQQKLRFIKILFWKDVIQDKNNSFTFRVLIDIKGQNWVFQPRRSLNEPIRAHDCSSFAIFVGKTKTMGKMEPIKSPKKIRKKVCKFFDQNYEIENGTTFEFICILFATYNFLINCQTLFHFPDEQSRNFSGNIFTH